MLDTAEGTPVSTQELTTATASDYSYKYFTAGHEYFPIFQGTRNANQNIHGNSANTNTDNAQDWLSRYGKVHPVVPLQ